MSTATMPMYRWADLPWKKFRKIVWKLQKRIYQAMLRGDVKLVRKLQKLLMKSRAAKFLAVRRVAQENSGKKTAGVDGVKSLTPSQRLRMASSLELDSKACPARRVWIGKDDSEELRPLGIPIMRDRALESLVKDALEPEWEARFEANSYGFRPGRSCHDAIEAIFRAIAQKAKFALDADIAKCFDRISHTALLAKVNASPPVQRQLKAWLKAGVMEGGELFPTAEGTMQGATVSPLLANIALHGLETAIVSSFPRGKQPLVVRYADDFVVLHSEQRIVEECAVLAQDWLKPMGLELKASKTRIAHSLEKVEGQAGFDFLGFNIRQYKVARTKSGKNTHGKPLGFKTIIKPSTKAIKKRVQSLRQTVDNHQGVGQAHLIAALNRTTSGWARYYSSVASKKVFSKVDCALFQMLWAWAKRRHPNKGAKWVANRYWAVDQGQGWNFQAPGHAQLRTHVQTPIRRHVKVAGKRTPFDGDWVYWSVRRGKSPDVSPRVARLLQKQQGHCVECGLYFRDGDQMAMAYINPQRTRWRETIANLMLVHQHCQDALRAELARFDGYV
jgi:RNA-directed DNA polymerase